MPPLGARQPQMQYSGSDGGMANLVKNVSLNSNEGNNTKI